MRRRKRYVLQGFFFSFGRKDFFSPLNHERSLSFSESVGSSVMISIKHWRGLIGGNRWFQGSFPLGFPSQYASVWEGWVGQALDKQISALLNAQPLEQASSTPLKLTFSLFVPTWGTVATSKVGVRWGGMHLCMVVLPCHLAADFLRRLCGFVREAKKMGQNSFALYYDILCVIFYRL